MFDLRKKVPETAALDQTSVEAKISELEQYGTLSFFQFSDPKNGWHGKCEMNISQGQWRTFVVEAGGHSDKMPTFGQCVATLLDRVRSTVEGR